MQERGVFIEQVARQFGNNPQVAGRWVSEAGGNIGRAIPGFELCYLTRAHAKADPANQWLTRAILQIAHDLTYAARRATSKR